MYKLVAIDLDGTMLNQYGVVTQQTKDAITKAQENGIEVIIASGRPSDSVKTLAKEIKSEKYFISGNGAIIYDLVNDEFYTNAGTGTFTKGADVTDVTGYYINFKVKRYEKDNDYGCGYARKHQRFRTVLLSGRK